MTNLTELKLNTNQPAMRLYFLSASGTTSGTPGAQENGQLIFEGNANDAARIFFDEVIRENCATLAALRQQLIGLGVTPAA